MGLKFHYFPLELPHVFLPGTVGHLVGTVEHPHQGLLVIDARQHNDHRCVVDDEIQVVFGEVKVDGLKAT